MVSGIAQLETLLQERLHIMLMRRRLQLDLGLFICETKFVKLIIRFRVTNRMSVVPGCSPSDDWSAIDGSPLNDNTSRDVIHVGGTHIKLFQDTS